LGAVLFIGSGDWDVLGGFSWFGAALLAPLFAMFGNVNSGLLVVSSVMFAFAN